jgi:hypothetical protein
MPLLFVLGTFPHCDPDAPCQLGTCHAKGALFVAVKWRGVAILQLCRAHAKQVHEALGPGVAHHGIPASVLEPPLRSGERLQQNYVHACHGARVSRGRRAVV